MSEILTAITATFTLITAIIAWRVKRSVHEVHLSLNSRLDQLVQSTGLAERAAGEKAGREAEQQRTKE